jgi:hypothetical protein
VFSTGQLDALTVQDGRERYRAAVRSLVATPSR